MEKTGRLKTWLKSIARERIIWVFILVIPITFFLGAKRKHQFINMTTDELWMHKVVWENCAEMVITGDSRVALGVSPESMKKVLGEIEILNFGFGGNGYGRLYMEHAAKVLYPKDSGKRRIIVTGITPLTLFKNSAEKGLFNTAIQRLGKQKKQVRFGLRSISPDLALFLRPMNRFNDIRLFVNRSSRRLTANCHDDGWIAGYEYPERPTAEVKTYGEWFEKNKPDQNVRDGLIEQVKKWVSGGITVYGFRAPSCKEMRELEDSKSGLTPQVWDEFIKRFESAGGKWIYMDQDAYHSYDGSHLTPTEAQKMSARLAEKIKEAGF